jgi:glycosyltransferase involved in cell wall biosynthesis
MSGALPRICFVGTHDPSFARTQLLAHALQARGFQVGECTEPAWGSTSDRLAAARAGVRNVRLATRLGGAYARLATRLRQLHPQPDVLLAAHPGQLDTLVLRRIAPGIPLVLDAFVSLDETVADRNIRSARSLAGLLDRLAFRTADLVICDTGVHAHRFSDEYGLDLERAVVVPVGSKDPGPCSVDCSPATPQRLEILYFGGFIPLHGVPIILEAARRLRDHREMHFTLVGDGQDWPAAHAFCEDHHLDNVTLHRAWMSESDLVRQYVCQADICLGIFADRPKTRDVVPAKLYLAMACGRPIVTADTPAVRQEVLSRSSQTALALSRPGDPDDLARTLLQLRDDPALRARLAQAARETYLAHFTPEQVIEPLVPRLVELHRRAATARR